MSSDSDPTRFLPYAAWALTAIAGLSFPLSFLFPRLPFRATFIVGLTVAGGLHALSLSPTWSCTASAIAIWGATASLVWALVAVACRSRRCVAWFPSLEGSCWALLASAASLWFGVVSGSVVCFLLALRMIHAVVETLWCVPWLSIERFGFNSDGLWAMGALCGAQIAVFGSSRDRRLAVSTFWTVVGLASWMVLLEPTLVSERNGGFHRSAAMLNLPLVWAVIVVLGSAATIIANRFAGIRAVVRVPERDRQIVDFISPMSVSVGVLALGMILPIWFYILVPLPRVDGTASSSVTWATVSCALGTIGCYTLLARNWSGLLADALLGCVTQAVCGVTVLLMPTSAGSMDDRFPIVFTAIILGLAITAAWFTWLAEVWRRQLDDRHAWTTEGHLISPLGRFVFLNLSLALVVGAVLTFWPRNPTVSTSDDSLGRVSGGLAAHLLVLLVALFAARCWRRPTVRLLSFVAIATTGAFLVVRMLPFRSHVG